jgi:hypothetical protein
VRTKCAEKTSVDLWGQSRNPRELSGVTGPGHGVAGVLHIQHKKYSCVDLANSTACIGKYVGHGLLRTWM